MKKIYYPETKRVNHQERYFDKIISDSYVWLEEARESEVVKWTESQNKVTDKYFAKEKEYDVEKLAKDIKQKIMESKYSDIIEMHDNIYAKKKDDKEDFFVVILDEDFKEKETIISPTTFDEKIRDGFFTPSPRNKDVIVVAGILDNEMQELNQSENPILLRVLEEGGHDRGRGEAMYKTFAEMQTFIAKELKL